MTGNYNGMMDVQHAGKTATAKLNISTPCQDSLDKFVKEFYFLSTSQTRVQLKAIQKQLQAMYSTYFLLS